MGTIDTPEKFQAKRLELAKEVWHTMQETDSRECRNCHGFDFMDLYGQGQVASEKHRQADQEGRTCIECHQGISHQLPEDYLEAEHERYEKEEVPCKDCHSDIEESAEGEDWDWDKED
jgi:cytochrome c-type protein NapC